MAEQASLRMLEHLTTSGMIYYVECINDPVQEDRQTMCH